MLTCSKYALTQDKQHFCVSQLLTWQALAAIDRNTSSTLCTSSAAFACNVLFLMFEPGNAESHRSDIHSGLRCIRRNQKTCVG